MWNGLKCRLHIGDDRLPAIAAFHGFGQRIESGFWRRACPGWRAWDFTEQSRLLEKCIERGWTCWIPQAPRRNWTVKHQLSPHAMHEEYKRVTGRTDTPYLMGLSDGMTLAASFLYQGFSAPGYVLYSGPRPTMACTPAHTSVCLVANVLERHPLIPSLMEHRLKDEMRALNETLSKHLDSIDLTWMVSDSETHEWCHRITNRILDWVNT